MFWKLAFVQAARPTEESLNRVLSRYKAPIVETSASVTPHTHEQQL